MLFFHIPKEKLLPVLVNRMATFFFLMCFLVLLMYAAGTIQGFIDTTQLALLRLYVFLGIFLASVSLSGVILNIVRLITAKKIRYITRIIIYLFLVFFAGATTIFAAFVITISL